MKPSEIKWNDEARAKILDDSDRVLRDAVVELAENQSDQSSDDVFAEINTRMKGRFIDYEPGPDVRKYADAIVAGEIETADSDGDGVLAPGATAADDVENDG